MRASHPLLLSALLALSGGRLLAQPSTAPAVAELAPADPQMQQWIRLLAQRPTSRTYEAYSDATMAIATARQNKVITSEAWLNQMFLYMLSVPDVGKRAVANARLARFSDRYARVELVPWLNFLVDRMNSSNPDIARVANELIQGFFLRWTSGYPDILRSYVGQLRDKEPSWKVVRMLYEPDPDGAMNELAMLKFNRGGALVQADAATRRGLARDQKELKYLMLSWQLAEGDRRAEWRDKVIAKLSALADHPEWFVRAYAATILLQERQNEAEPNRNALDDPALMAKLAADPNPFVAGLAKRIWPK